MCFKWKYTETFQNMILLFSFWRKRTQKQLEDLYTLICELHRANKEIQIKPFSEAQQHYHRFDEEAALLAWSVCLLPTGKLDL
ncbi:MAG: hypothetical protein GY820_23950 [Gammaproteobacteria bacterium]|nr:hypothetical protein [Gammaproteobacteria bacterium]